MKNSAVKTIIVTSDEPWCDIWHTQLHYANQLSKRFNVVFLDPPLPWKFSNLFLLSPITSKISDTLTVVRYHNLVPAKFGKISLWINDKLNSFLLRKNVLGNLGAEKGIVWHFDPHRSYYIFKNNARWKHLFHVIDPIAGNNLDIPLATMANLVVVTSPKFLDHYTALNKNVLQIGQGVDLKFYSESVSPANISTEYSADSIMLLGTITDHIHFKLLMQIAGRFPNKLVLIGPDKIQSESAKIMFQELIQIEGVRWFGAMPPADFRHHLLACRIGIIAYDNTVHYKNDFRSPLKVISYLACGKNIISNIDCEIPSLVNEAIYNVNSDDEYFQLIEKCYNDKLYFNHEQVRKYLEKIDYNNLLQIIFEKIGEKLPPLA